MLSTDEHGFPFHFETYLLLASIIQHHDLVLTKHSCTLVKTLRSWGRVCCLVIIGLYGVLPGATWFPAMGCRIRWQDFSSASVAFRLPASTSWNLQVTSRNFLKHFGTVIVKSVHLYCWCLNPIWMSYISAMELRSSRCHLFFFHSGQRLWWWGCSLCLRPAEGRGAAGEDPMEIIYSNISYGKWMDMAHLQMIYRWFPHERPFPVDFQVRTLITRGNHQTVGISWVLHWFYHGFTVDNFTGNHPENIGLYWCIWTKFFFEKRIS